MILSLQELEFVFDPVTRLSHREFKSRLPGLMGSLKPARTRQRRDGGVRPGSKLPRPLTGFPRSPPAPPPPTHHRGRPHSPAPFLQVSQLPDGAGGGTGGLTSPYWPRGSHPFHEGAPIPFWGGGDTTSELGYLGEGAEDSVKTVPQDDWQPPTPLGRN